MQGVAKLREAALHGMMMKMKMKRAMMITEQSHLQEAETCLQVK